MLPSGELCSLYVDPQKWQEDVHQKKGIKCIDCHEGMTPFSHPKEGSRKVACERCHPEACEENQLNLHNAYFGLTDKLLPECYDCHTKHNVRKKSDPDSSVSREKIGETCCSCHQNIIIPRFSTLLPTNLILGHRKCNTNARFNLKICINCHDDAGHGPLSTYPEYCGRCHNPKKTVNFLSATHFSEASFPEKPFRFLMERLGIILNLTLVIGVFMVALVYGTRFFKARRKKEKFQEGDKK